MRIIKDVYGVKQHPSVLLLQMLQVVQFHMKATVATNFVQKLVQQVVTVAMILPDVVGVVKHKVVLILQFLLACMSTTARIVVFWEFAQVV